MDFLEISSLGAPYRYAIKIDQKIKQWSKQDFGFTNTPQYKHGKSNSNSQSER
jgi:hypothetical protein